MQPSNTSGRRLRFAMMPISWIIAFLVLYEVFAIIASLSSTTIRGLLQADSLCLLAVFLPAFFFGKVLGLMTLNLVAFSIPAARRIFDTEVSETGRHSFRKAMLDLSRIATVAGVVTILTAIFYLWIK